MYHCKMALRSQDVRVCGKHCPKKANFQKSTNGGGDLCNKASLAIRQVFCHPSSLVIKCQKIFSMCASARGSKHTVLNFWHGWLLAGTITLVGWCTRPYRCYLSQPTCVSSLFHNLLAIIEGNRNSNGCEQLENVSIYIHHVYHISVSIYLKPFHHWRWLMLTCFLCTHQHSRWLLST